MKIIKYNNMTEQDFTSVLSFSNNDYYDTVYLIDTRDTKNSLYIIDSGSMWCQVSDVPDISNKEIANFTTKMDRLSNVYGFICGDYEGLLKEFYKLYE